MNKYKRLLNTKSRARRGAITILAAILSIFMLGMVAFSVDVGYVLSVKEELQRTADAAALAAVWDYGDRMSDGEDYILSEQSARENAQQFATSNTVGNNGPTLDKNLSNSPSGDMVFGHVNDFYNPIMTTGTSSASTPYNAVRVKVRRNEDLNGDVPMFFGRVFGVNGTDLEAEATAALVRDVSGFSIPHDGSNIDLLPFALDLQTWNNWTAGSGTDNYRWDASQKKITAGSDGKLEVNLYPQGTGSPGNRGTVDIGSSNNSTADIVRQILYGVNASDLSYHGGTLAFDQCGKLYLNGDTGISAGVKDDRSRAPAIRG